MTNESSPLDPKRLSVEQVAKLLSAAGKVRIPAEHIETDFADGAPRNPDGTIISAAPRPEAAGSAADKGV
jgi:hypothetical protein